MQKRSKKIVLGYFFVLYAITLSFAVVMVATEENHPKRPEPPVIKVVGPRPTIYPADK